MRSILTMVVAGLFVTATATATAQAQTQCPSYVGQIVTPMTFDQALAATNVAAPKGEFETTAAYQERLAKSGTNVPLVVQKQPEDTKYLEYDADRQAFAVKSYFFHNKNFPAWETFYHAANGVKAGTSSNIAIVIDEEVVEGGSYKAQNSYGATTEVSKITRKYKAIFEREGKGFNESLFPDSNDIIGYVPVEISLAPNFRSLAKSAFVVTPKPPYLTKAAFSYGETTIRNPYDVKADVTVLMADIQCALLLDRQNKVLASFATR